MAAIVTTPLSLYADDRVEFAGQVRTITRVWIMQASNAVRIEFADGARVILDPHTPITAHA